MVYRGWRQTRGDDFPNSVMAGAGVWGPGRSSPSKFRLVRIPVVQRPSSQRRKRRTERQDARPTVMRVAERTRVTRGRLEARGFALVETDRTDRPDRPLTCASRGAPALRDHRRVHQAGGRKLHLRDAGHGRERRWRTGRRGRDPPSGSVREPCVRVDVTRRTGLPQFVKTGTKLETLLPLPRADRLGPAGTGDARAARPRSGSMARPSCFMPG